MMKCILRSAISLALFWVGPMGYGTGVAHAEAVCGSGWQISPSPEVYRGQLVDVSMPSPGHAWAVGTQVDPASDAVRTLAERWDGTSWSVVPGPEIPNSRAVRLQAVSAASAKDVWAVGYDSNRSRDKVLIEHWDGASWTIAPSPSPGVGAILNDVAALGPKDVWAVGRYQDPNVDITKALIEHWDGSRWSRIAARDDSQSAGKSGLDSLAAISANDVWAFGWHLDATGHEDPLGEHWDGSRWSKVVLPTVSNSSRFIWAATAISSQDVWTVGNGIVSGTTIRGFSEHWDGSQWRVADVAAPNPGDTWVRSISARGPSDLYAVVQDNSSARSAIEHWDGDAWTYQPVAALDAPTSLVGVAAAGRRLFAVGGREGYPGGPVIVTSCPA